MARILVIDDDAAVRRLARRMLAHSGLVVHEAANGKQAMTLLEQHAFDLVITDIFMPEQDGIETLRILRKAFPGVNVIVMTGGESAGPLDMKESAEFLGAVRSLEKPFTSAELLVAVRAALGSRDD